VAPEAHLSQLLSHLSRKVSTDQQLSLKALSDGRATLPKKCANLAASDSRYGERKEASRRRGSNVLNRLALVFLIPQIHVKGATDSGKRPSG